MGWPVVVVDSGGLPVTEAANGLGIPVSIATNGIGTAVTPVDGYGIPVVGTGGITAQIQLSSATISDTASIGDVVGTLSVSNGSGSYTYTLTDDAGGLFAIDVAAVEVAAALTAGSYSITVQADNGVDTPISRAFLITVTDEVVVGPSAPVLAMGPSWTSADDTPDFRIFVDNTIGAGDDVRLQIQVAGGDWSSPVSDTTRTITSGEDGANEIDLSLGALSNNDYEARALVNDGTANSDWSNVVSFTIAAAGASSGLYMYPYLGV